MLKLLKLGFLGALIGAAVGAAKAYQADEPGDVVKERATKTGAQGFVAGATFGLFLNRRSKKRAAKQRMKVGGGLATGGIVEAARAARPAIEHALESALEAATHAAEVARPHVEHVAEVARPKVEQAARATRDRALEAADVALPKVERAARHTRERVKDALDRVA